MASFFKAVASAVSWRVAARGGVGILVGVGLGVGVLVGVEWARGWGRSLLFALESCILQPLLRTIRSLDDLAAEVKRLTKAHEAVVGESGKLRVVVSAKFDEFARLLCSEGDVSREGTVKLLEQLESIHRELVRLEDIAVRESTRVTRAVDSSIEDYSEEVLMAVQDIVDAARYGVRLLEARYSSPPGSAQPGVPSQAGWSQSQARFRSAASAGTGVPPPPQRTVVLPPTNPQSPDL